MLKHNQNHNIYVKNIYNLKKMCYNHTMSALDVIFSNHNLNAVIIANPYNVKFLSGFLADYCYIMITPKNKFYFTDGRFIIEANRDLTNDWEVIEIAPHNAEGVIKSYIEKLNIDCSDNRKSQTKINIGFDSDLSYYEYSFIHDKLLSDYNCVDITDDLVKARAIKSDIEIENITKAQRIAEKSLEQVKAYIKEGISELELCARLEFLMKINGSIKPSFDTIVAFGENSAIAHAKPSDRKLKKGDVILIDFGATYKGYCSDMTRTFVFGECSEEIENIYNIVLGANEIAISAMRSGIPPREADRVARNFIDLHGYGECFIHSLGHGVGLEIHEYPRLSSNNLSDERLLDNMVITIEPGIYIEGKFGIRIEDMIVVKGAKAVNLTTSNKNLEIINN